MTRPSLDARRRAATQDLAEATAPTVEISDYDPSWPARFEEERARLTPLLPGAEIHHIGSTAVPGLAAKPVIDLMALMKDLDTHVQRLVDTGGYSYPRAFNELLGVRRFLCRPSAEERTHHLHLVADRRELERHLRFRDALRGDPAVADEYLQLKRELAARLGHDREAYADAKSDFVARVITAGI